MNKISKKFLRFLLFAALFPGLLGCAASLLFSAADLIFWIQADVYTMPEILESLVIRTADALTPLPVFLLFLAVCLGLRNGKRLQSLYTASLICAVLLAVAAVLTDFRTDGIPEWEAALRQSLAFVPAMLVAADALLEHRFLIPARLGAPAMILLCGWRIGRMLPDFSAFPNDFSLWQNGINAVLLFLYWLAVTMLVYGQLVYYPRLVNRKVKTLEEILDSAKKEYAKGGLTEEEYKTKKAQVMKYL